MLAATVILFTHFHFDDAIMVVIPLITAVLALLMVSNLRYYSFKDVDFRRRRPFNVLVALILLLILFLAEPEILLFAGAALYVLSGPGAFLFKLKKKKLQKEILEESQQY
jgi:CDP-diacylglycerol--serine O-phosphatidyltransferase